MRSPSISPAREHFEHARVGVSEHRPELHPEAREVVDVEETPVVDLVLRDAEEGDAPDLRLDQPVEFAPVGVEGGDARLDRGARALVVARQRREFRLQPGCRCAGVSGFQFGRSRKAVGHPLEPLVLAARARVG